MDTGDIVPAGMVAKLTAGPPLMEGDRAFFVCDSGTFIGVARADGSVLLEERI